VERWFGSEDSTQNQAKEAYLGSNDLLGQESVPVCGLGYPSHADRYMYAGDAVAQVKYLSHNTKANIAKVKSSVPQHSFHKSSNAATLGLRCR